MHWWCANNLCGKRLTDDHVILITGHHTRRFCGVDCIMEGKKYADYLIIADTWMQEGSLPPVYRG